MDIGEIRDAYDHARDFLAEDATLHNLTSVERTLCESVVGMYEVIVELWEVSHGWKVHSDNLHQALIECCHQNDIMRSALIAISTTGDELGWMARNRAHEALAKGGDKP